MAYVVARPNQRFEVRESVHTAKGPRARTLASFRELSDTVLARARTRSSRPFDAGAVWASAVRAGAKVGGRPPVPQDPALQRFVQASRRMADTLADAPTGPRPRPDPGQSLIELLGFADQIRGLRPDPAGGAADDAHAREPLTFPPLAHVLAGRRRTEAGGEVR